MKKIIVLLLSFAVLAVVMAGCDNIKPKDEIVSVMLADNVFKGEYKLDEELNPDGIFVTAVHKSGQQSKERGALDMVEGFDTSTTGAKKLRVKYKDCIPPTSTIP